MSTPQTFKINQETIFKTAQQRLRNENFAKIFASQVWTEASIRIRKKINFRHKENTKAVGAYGSMDIGEFEGINARQRWSNWRTVPRNLRHLSLQSPVVAIDLCSGVGHSTDVLACYLPSGSRILGLEYNRHFVEHASRTQYLNLRGEPCDVQFRVQSVLEKFCNKEGDFIPDASVDLVNSNGAIGVHFDLPALKVLIREVYRVLKPSGVAMIDVGLLGPKRRSIIKSFQDQGFRVSGSARSCVWDPYLQVRFIK